MRTLPPIICMLLASGLASAQNSDDAAEMEETFAMVRDFMAVERELTIEEELRLTDSEADEFWPLYEDYRAEINAIQDRNAELIAN